MTLADLSAHLIEGFFQEKAALRVQVRSQPNLWSFSMCLILQVRQAEYLFSSGQDHCDHCHESQETEILWRVSPPDQLSDVALSSTRPTPLKIWGVQQVSWIYGLRDVVKIDEDLFTSVTLHCGGYGCELNCIYIFCRAMILVLVLCHPRNSVYHYYFLFQSNFWQSWHFNTSPNCKGRCSRAREKS